MGIALTLEPGLGTLDMWLPAPAAGIMYQLFVEPMVRFLLESPRSSVAPDEANEERSSDVQKDLAPR